MYNYYCDYSSIDNIEGLIIGKALIKLRLQRQYRAEEDKAKKLKIRNLLKEINRDIMLLKDEQREYNYSIWG